MKIKKTTKERTAPYRKVIEISIVAGLQRKIARLERENHALSWRLHDCRRKLKKIQHPLDKNNIS